jgi:DNA-binding NarL/FixJ family response regulator
MTTLANGARPTSCLTDEAPEEVSHPGEPEEAGDAILPLKRFEQQLALEVDGRADRIFHGLNALTSEIYAVLYQDKARTLRTLQEEVGDLGPSNASATIASSKASPRPLRPLTCREQEILGLVAEGFSNKLIGCQLYITECTVKNHLTNIMAKLHAEDRTHAVVTAVRRGWLSL